jgi:hypothetical protein
MGSFASVVRGALANLNEGAGNAGAADDLRQANQRVLEQKQNLLRMAIAPHAIAIQGLRTRLSALDPKQNPEEYAALTHDIARNLSEMRLLMDPNHNPQGNFFERGISDKLHLTSLKARQDKEKGRQQAAQKQGEEGAEAIAQGTPPYSDSPQFQTERMKALDAQRAEQQKSEAAAALDAQKAKEAQTLEANKELSAQKIESDRLAVQQAREDEMQTRFEQTQRAIESRFERSQSRQQQNEGTWSVAEDSDGNPVLFNSKTGEQKAAPAGMHKSGFYAKQIAPLEAASMNIKSYLDGGVFDGAGDLTLQHEFFTATQPSTGFRMTKVQQDILQSSQSWLNSWQAKAKHAATGTWFSDEQRKQIARAAQEAIDAKKAVLGRGGAKTDQLNDTRQQQSSGVIVVSPEDMK